MELALKLDDELHTVLDRRARDNGFDSTEEYCETVLEMVVEEIEQDSTGAEVEDRLEDLGYLN